MTMATPIDQAFFTRLNELNDQFAAGVPATLARLHELRLRFDEQAPDAALAQQMHQVLHTVAGSAATFGFRVLGLEARHLEQRLRVLMVFQEVPPRDWSNWLMALDEYIVWAQTNPRAADYVDGSM
jgi:HPt (histidine-containing phosphotransfer) domain-containing protein